MFRNLTLNSVVWILMGIGCVLAGGYYGWMYRYAITRMFPLPGGLFLIGLAMTICGITNGFTDQSPLGRKLKKAGILLFLAGIPLSVYAFSRFI
jgi:hypothetical protein